MILLDNELRLLMEDFADRGVSELCARKGHFIYFAKQTADGILLEESYHCENM